MITSFFYLFLPCIQDRQWENAYSRELLSFGSRYKGGITVMSQPALLSRQNVLWFYR